MPRLSFFLPALLFLICHASITAQQARANRLTAEFRGAAAQLAAAPSDNCTLVNSASPPENISGLEDQIFETTDAAILEGLHASDPIAAVQRSLDILQSVSAEIDSAWPEANRFHYKLLQIDPVLVVQFGLRSRETYSVFAVPQLKPAGPRVPNHDWLQVATDPLRFGIRKGNEQLELTALFAGPLKRARFLAHYTFAGCGDAQRGIAYKGYEWNPNWTGKIHLILDREGAVSGQMYPTIGELHTSGNKISLPYCWWSAVDESSWASLCSVDQYDLSGDLVKFIATETNRPDLETVARAIEYGERRDVSALLGYAIDRKTAQDIAQNMPAYVYPDVVTVEQLSPVRESVSLGDGPVLHFTIAKLGTRWVVQGLVVKIR